MHIHAQSYTLAKLTELSVSTRECLRIVQLPPLLLPGAVWHQVAGNGCIDKVCFAMTCVDAVIKLKELSLSKKECRYSCPCCYHPVLFDVKPGCMD